MAKNRFLYKLAFWFYCVSEKMEYVEKEKEQIEQKEQKKGLRKTLCVYYPNGQHEEYTNEEYQWEYLSETIRGEIRQYQDLPYEVYLYQYTILNIVKRDKTEIIRISGNYAVKEVYEP
jgi:hypothetical protein